MYEENDYQKEKDQKKKITYHSPLIPLLENSLKEKPQEEGNVEKGENKEEKGGNLQENNNEEIKK